MTLRPRPILSNSLLPISAGYYPAVVWRLSLARDTRGCLGLPGVSTSNGLIPDVFATHKGMYRSSRVPNESGPEEFRVGVAERQLFDCVILFESTLTYSDAAFGRVVRYLEYIDPYGPACAIF